MKSNEIDRRSRAKSESSNRGARTARQAIDGELVRLCVACRSFKPRENLIRLTVETSTGALKLNDGNTPVHGRSAYLCRSQSCVTLALKGRLKGALEGRKGKELPNRRSVRWPLEPQLIQQISSQCTEP
ncbi:MAG TPA: YlxR family protein [Planktothrix sp.]|jgi:predicted RNA-binding protein YlxR (DUF448 family)